MTDQTEAARPAGMPTDLLILDAVSTISLWLGIKVGSLSGGTVCWYDANSEPLAYLSWDEDRPILTVVVGGDHEIDEKTYFALIGYCGDRIEWREVGI